MTNKCNGCAIFIASGQYNWINGNKIVVNNINQMIKYVRNDPQNTAYTKIINCGGIKDVDFGQSGNGYDTLGFWPSPQNKCNNSCPE